MARRARYVLPDQPMHVIQRGNNREATFFQEEDYALYHAAEHLTRPQLPHLPRMQEV